MTATFTLHASQAKLINQLLGLKLVRVKKSKPKKRKPKKGKP